MEKTNYVGYEYSSVAVKNHYLHLYEDGYQHFGWSYQGSEAILHKLGYTQMKFKRNRQLENKQALIKAQRVFDGVIQEIDRLEQAKVILPATVAYGIGLVGTAFISLSVFALTLWHLPLLMVVSAVLGAIAWIIPYFVYVRLKHQKVLKLTPQIDEQYDRLYQLTKDANLLINTQEIK